MIVHFNKSNWPLLFFAALWSLSYPGLLTASPGISRSKPKEPLDPNVREWGDYSDLPPGSRAGIGRLWVITAPSHNGPLPSYDGEQLEVNGGQKALNCRLAERDTFIVTIIQNAMMEGRIQKTTFEGEATVESLDPDTVSKLLHYLELTSQEQGFTMLVLKKNLRASERFPYPVRIEAVLELIDQFPVRKLEKITRKGSNLRCKTTKRSLEHLPWTKKLPLRSIEEVNKDRPDSAVEEGKRTHGGKNGDEKKEQNEFLDKFEGGKKVNVDLNAQQRGNSVHPAERRQHESNTSLSLHSVTDQNISSRLRSISLLRSELGLSSSDLFSMTVTDYDIKPNRVFEAPPSGPALFEYIDNFASRRSEKEKERRALRPAPMGSKSLKLIIYCSGSCLKGDCCSSLLPRGRLLLPAAALCPQWTGFSDSIRHFAMLKLIGTGNKASGTVELFPLNGHSQSEVEPLSRDMVNNLREQLKISKDYFSMLFVGKDSDVKAWFPSPMWTLDNVYDLVDSTEQRVQEEKLQKRLGIHCPEDRGRGATTETHTDTLICCTSHTNHSDVAEVPGAAVLSMANKADVKAMMARFQAGGVSTDESSFTPPGRIKPHFNPHPLLRPHHTHKETRPGSSEAKGPLQKPPPFNKPQLSPTLSDLKPTYPKPPINSKPSWVNEEDSGGGLQPKPSSSIGKLMQQNEELAGAGLNTANKPSPPANLFKPPINFRTAQNTFNKESDNGQVADDKPSNGRARKPPLTATNSLPPPKPLASKKPSIKKPPKLFPQTSSITNDATSGPKKNPLPNSLALGPAPAKPNRPPNVHLESFKRGTVASDNGPGSFKKPTLPIPSHASIHSNNMTPPQPPQPAVPRLPPGHPGAMMQQGEFREDPPPLPPSTGHPSQRAKAEKKQKKEREKKEQDARKKYKLVGSLDVIHQGKACVDYKGSKTDLALKHGDCLDIIRVMGNPEGKWVGRLQDGSIGYVKTTSVEIDFNTLKKHKSEPAYDPEVYDDIDVMSSDNSGMKRPGVVLPPPPGDGEEIYDDIDPNLDVIPTDCRSSPKKPRSFLQMFDRNGRLSSTKEMPPPEQFNADGNSAIDEDIYDDVDSQSGPPVPPTISSLPSLKGRSKTLEMDPKKQKKFEKEEKEFRKKFKYEGEIQVLNQVTIAPTLTNKKWSGKELAVRAGEKLDVIVNAVDNKLICRNDEGKFGYVSTGHIFTDDGDIYDDIGDDCIYDND
ncbi:hypothetical protein KUCAC02_008884 [Chaenocephalus aceratus]|uniref:Uncharacterized protein n=1 Tax=Chaenocephalus aceratus TaxID=36190 RepID=A0ACB9WTD0_CHAAC|nr:hypothetical protein KUCAC02_008884 [Chaenocephalus aceratus]